MTSVLVLEIQRAVDILLRNGAREVYVFGSHARGDAAPGSDLLLIGNSTPRFTGVFDGGSAETM